jgi:hypothetical protein
MANELVAKIAQAALQVGGALKADKTNQEQRYDYISADKILSICGQALFSNGVIVVPEVDNQAVEFKEYLNKYEKKMQRYDAQVEFVMTITDGNDKLEAKWVGLGSDYTTPDKALYKAITSGHKYFLMKLLNIGAGNEDSEHETEPPRPAAVITRELGYDDPIQYPPELAIVTNAEGVPYVDLDTDKLNNMLLGINKALRKPDLTDDQTSQYSMKHDAIRQILALRQGK